MKIMMIMIIIMIMMLMMIMIIMTIMIIMMMMEEHGNFRLFVKISHYHSHPRKIVKSATYRLENAD